MGKLSKVVESYVEHTLEEHSNFDRKRIFITHTPIDENICKAVKLQLSNTFDEIYDTTAGATISSHCGLETIGILFLTK